jgi:uncharacterized membrane protein YkoI
MKHHATAFLFALLTLAAVPAHADVGPDQAAAIAQRASPGRVLAVDRATVAGRPAWRVKLVTQGGEVRVVMVDAATGRPF